MKGAGAILRWQLEHRIAGGVGKGVRFFKGEPYGGTGERKNIVWDCWEQKRGKVREKGGKPILQKKTAKGWVSPGFQDRNQYHGKYDSARGQKAKRASAILQDEQKLTDKKNEFKKGGRFPTSQVSAGVSRKVAFFRHHVLQAFAKQRKKK